MHRLPIRQELPIRMEDVLLSSFRLYHIYACAYACVYPFENMLIFSYGQVLFQRFEQFSLLFHQKSQRTLIKYEYH